MDERLVSAVPSSSVLTGPEMAPYLRDATEAAGVRGRADAVVLPETPEQVAAVVAWAYDRGVAVTPRGGGTGYAGGGVPSGGILLSLERLTRVRELAPLEWRIVVDAGVTTATVQRLARENGAYYAPDPGAPESSQIGGNVATNAGGPHCFKYGVTRAWVTGVEAVLAPGELVRFGGAARKDVAGYDLAGLLCGSEGTLGVITAVWLKLLPAPAGAWPVLAAFPDAAAAGEALARVRACGVIPAALEYLDAATMEAAGRAAEFTVIAEADTSAADADTLAEALGGQVQPLGVRSSDVGSGLGNSARVDPAARWRWREGISLAVRAKRGAKRAEDIAVPVERLPEAVEGVLEIGARHGLEACSWGHAGDGNLHANFLLGPGEDASAACEDVCAMAIALGGTVSGEHGLGRLKTGRLAQQWSPAAVAAHRAIKDALDPRGLMNPGVKEP